MVMSILFTILGYLLIIYIVVASILSVAVILIVLWDYKTVLEIVKNHNPELYKLVQVSPIKWKVTLLVGLLLLALFFPLIIIYNIVNNKLKTSP